MTVEIMSTYSKEDPVTPSSKVYIAVKPFDESGAKVITTRELSDFIRDIREPMLLFVYRKLSEAAKVYLDGIKPRGSRYIVELDHGDLSKPLIGPAAVSAYLLNFHPQRVFVFSKGYFRKNNSKEAPWDVSELVEDLQRLLSDAKVSVGL